MAATLSNNGNASLSIAGIASSGDFAETNSCSASLAIGSSCAIQVKFTPTATGTRTGTLTVDDNASGSPQVVSLKGTGTAPAPSASLSPGKPTALSRLRRQTCIPSNNLRLRGLKSPDDHLPASL